MLEAAGTAVVLFAVTNVDDLVLLALYFGQAGGDRAAQRRIVVGQYLGFGAILMVSLVGAAGATLLPERAIAYLGLIPLALGIRAGVSAWRHRHDDPEERPPSEEGVSALGIAEITVANGGDNIGVYVPAFAVAGARVRWGHLLLPVVLVVLGVVILVQGGAFRW